MRSEVKENDMETAYAMDARCEIGAAIMLGLDGLAHPYVLFDVAGRLRYANAAFHQLFGGRMGQADIFALLREHLGIDDFSNSYSDGDIEALCIGVMQHEDGSTSIYRVLGSQMECDGETLFQCVIAQIRPLVALQIGIRDFGVGDWRRLAKFVGQIAVEVDPEETGEHLVRTSRHMRLMCLAMKEDMLDCFSEEEIESAATYSILHDVGKMHIPSRVLHKMETLNEFEWNIIKGHVAAGLAVAESLSLPNVAADIIAFHHCRWDGLPDRWDAQRQRRDDVRGGYPFSAKGADIPLFARAFAYADIFDALTSPRSYKSGWAPEEAVAFMRDKLCGAHLDPAIYPSFLKSLEGVERCNGGR
jgi:hypothetical protein